MLQRKAEREREKGAILPNCYGKIILSEKAGRGRSDDGGGDDDGVWTVDESAPLDGGRGDGGGGRSHSGTHTQTGAHLVQVRIGTVLSWTRRYK